MEFKNYIRERRTKLGMSLRTLAEELYNHGYEISHSGISHWESGRNNPPLHDPSFRALLADILKVDVNEMMADLGYIVVEDDHTPEARRAAQIIDRLPAERRFEALSYLEFLQDRVFSR